MQRKQALLNKKGKQNWSSNRIYNKSKRKFLHLMLRAKKEICKYLVFKDSLHDSMCELNPS